MEHKVHHQRNHSRVWEHRKQNCDQSGVLVESLIRVMYWVVAVILNWPFKYLNINFCAIFVHISAH